MKRHNLHINDDLLIRYLADEITDAERTAVESWLAENEGNEQKLAGYRAIFEESKALKPGRLGDVDRAWSKFKQKIDEQAETEATSYPYRKWLSIAAGILVIMSLGIWFYLHQPSAINFYTNDQPLVDRLPDGSLISLSTHSSLSFKPGRVREAILKGEAFFEVKHDAAHPFRIKVNDVLINVLGTSFNVKTIGDQTEVMVRSGIVSISGENQSIQLQAGDQVLAVPGQHWQKRGQTGFDINHYPGLLQALLKDPQKWASLLKNFRANTDSSSQAAKNKALVRSIIDQLVSEGIAVPGRVQAFHLSGTGFIINGILQPDAVFRRYKAKYLPSDDFVIAFGNEPIKGKGIFVPKSTF